MYKVLLVDDEPASISLMKTIIEGCQGFSVIGIAESGHQCLKRIEDEQPDIVITDIKMPGMTGVELVKQIHEAYPDIIMLAVSGYSEFEYAKAMLKYGVMDYLLKPIVPSEMREVMKHVKKQADSLYRMKRNRILHQRDHVNHEEVKQYFHYPFYSGILIRKNGLPRRFEEKANEEIFQEMNDIFYFGRDKMETLYLFPSDILDQDIVESILKKEKEDAGYITAIMTKAPIPVEELMEIIKNMYWLLDTRLVNGVDQIIYLEEYGREAGKKSQYNIKKMLSRFESFMDEQRKEEAKKELDRLTAYWESIEISQWVLERIVDYIMVLCADLMENISWDAGDKNVYDDMFYSQNSIRDIMTEVKNNIFRENPETEGVKLDTPEFFQAITRYLENHISENMTLKSIGKEFGISQTYLGTLFCKYNHKPFSHYLMELRLEKAKRIFQIESDLLIKDVASMTGYRDQFYFSRIFRSYTGMSPTEYIEFVKNNKEASKKGETENESGGNRG